MKSSWLITIAKRRDLGLIRTTVIKQLPEVYLLALIQKTHVEYVILWAKDIDLATAKALQKYLKTEL